MSTQLLKQKKNYDKKRKIKEMTKLLKKNAKTFLMDKEKQSKN